MLLKRFSYREVTKGPFGEQEWRVQSFELGRINLIVGKNASGKTRLTNVITVLGRLVAGKIVPIFSSGTWDASFERSKGQSVESQSYELSVENGTVVKENFHVGRSQILERRRDGISFIIRKGKQSHAHKENRVQYKVPGNQLAAVVRRDEIQHPFFDQLFEWGNDLCFYRFGSDFGKHSGAAVLPAFAMQQPFHISNEVDNAVAVYRETFTRFGEKYDSLILNDLAKIDYDCNEVGLVPLPNMVFNGIPPLVLSVQEKDLKARTTQGEMSQGMYRALAIIVHINANILWTQEGMRGRTIALGDAPMIVIDDIGEGLDFDRSRRLVDLLMKKSEEHNIQLIMSSNDRFIMNDVPLEYWTVLHRTGGVVHPINHANNKKIFEDFEYLGLNNFDFFSNKIFLGEQE
jgi:hypothetical protein